MLEGLEGDDKETGHVSVAKTGKHTVGELEEDQRKELEELLEEFKDVLQDKPGRTNLVEHKIETAKERPVRHATSISLTTQSVSHCEERNRENVRVGSCGAIR